MSVVKSKKAILSEDLESYPVASMKEYKKISCIKIPEKVFQKKKKYFFNSSSHRPETSTNDKVECLICFEEFKDEDLVRIIPCYHPFHKQCIDTWLLGESGSCPTCRLDLRLTPEREIGNQYQNINLNQQSNQNHILYNTTNRNFNSNSDIYWVNDSVIDQTYEWNQVIEQIDSIHTSNTNLNTNAIANRS
ncbi:hypothetical protein BB558_002971 [Smittium angustum]|uniref:RING-type domain-containing protein n=1 Tax=Smittium angustum TaxID=133377 RepID=A0A2U1J7F4_SMIAN|nr:hypothetical protein BB558_002971 [Smittium angustum]